MRISRNALFLILVNFITVVFLLIIATKLWVIRVSKERAVTRLTNAARNFRVTEARFSGEFLYAPYTAPVSSTQKKQQLELLETQRKLLTQDINLANTIYDGKLSSLREQTSFSLSKGRGTSLSLLNYQSSVFLDPFSSTLYFSDLTRVILTKPILTRGEIKSDKEMEIKNALDNNPEYQKVALDIMITDNDSQSLDSAEGMAVFYTFKSEFKFAIGRLEEALKLWPNDARLLNDLAVVYLARAYDEENPADIFEALSFVDSAITADPNLLEAQYNRSLILQKLYLYPSAKKYWEEYLPKETSKEWKTEISKYIAELDKPTLTELWGKEKNKLTIAANKNDEQTVKALVSQFPHFARLAALDELLPTWANAYLKGDFGQANQALQTAQAIGKTLIEIQDDHLVADTVATITRLSQQSTATQGLTALAQAHLSYQEGRKLGEIEDFEKANKPLAEALTIFSKYNDSALTALIYLNQARSYFARLESKNAFDKLQQAQVLSEKSYYPHLLGCIWSLSGNEQLKLFQFTKALEANSLAIKYLKHTRALNSLAIALISYSQILSNLAEPKQVLNQYLEVLETLSKIDSPLQKSVSNLSTAIYLTRISKVKTMFYFYNEVLDVASKNKLDKIIFTLLCWRSLAYHKIGNEDSALQDIKQARASLIESNDETFRLRAEDELAIAEGECIFKKEPEKSIKLFTQLINSYLQAKGEQEQIAYLYLLRARAYLNLSDYQNAENDLKASIQKFEIARSNIKYEAFRTNFFEKPQEIYDEMIQLQLKLNHPDIAFEYSEVRQARALLDLLNTKTREVELLNDPQFILDNTTQPLNLLKIQEKLPANVTLISYAFLSEKLYIWCVTKDQIHSVQSPVKEEEIKALITRFYGSIGNYAKREAIKPILTSLYQGIFQPILPFVSQDQTLVFIPSKSLYQIPFPALVDDKTDQYLIEKQKVMVSPSATIFIKCLEKKQQLAKQKFINNILAIGDPKFNHKKFHDLSDLSGAELEAKKVIQFYPSSQLLLHEEATKTKFLSLANNYNVIHFAGHSIMDAQSPLYSELVFAEGEDKQQSSGLYAYELYKQKFNHTKLVVLAACKTANGRSLNNEGIANLARPFLAAGVPTVVASLWNASDDVSAELFIAFHKKLIATNDPVEALQSAQLHLINHSNPNMRLPQMWAPFVLLGGF